MALLPYKFKPFKFLYNSKHNLPNTRDFFKIDHEIACNDEYLITYECGHIPDQQLLSTTNITTEYTNSSLWKYNLITCSWENIKCKNLPIRFKCSSIILSGNLVIIHGGSGPRFSNNFIYQTFIGNLSKEYNSGDYVDFEEIPSTNGIPKKGYGQPIIMRGQFVYTVNGMSMDNQETEHELDVYRFDLSKKKWEVLYLANGYHVHTVNRFKHKVAYYNKRLHMFNYVQLDGDHGNVHSPQMFKKMYIFDLTSNEWQYFDMFSEEPSSEYPENRIHYSWTQDMSRKEYIYVSGGFNGRVFLKDLWRLNLITLKWVKLSSCELPRPAFFHLITVTQLGRMYYLDGINSGCETGRCFEQCGHLSQNQSIMSAWIQIPKLKTICWDAMLYYFKDQMLASSESSLRELGLPLDYCKQIINSKLKM